MFLKLLQLSLFPFNQIGLPFPKRFIKNLQIKLRNNLVRFNWQLQLTITLTKLRIILFDLKHLFFLVFNIIFIIL